MTTLVELREKLKMLYGKCGVYVQMVLKFALALAIFLFVSDALDFNSKLSNIFLLLILALVCSILPLQAISLAGCALMVGQCFSLSPEVGVLAVILLLAILLLYLRIAARDSLALVLTPLAFSLGIPAAVPMGFGLLGGVASCLSAGCGVVFYTFLHAVQNHVQELQAEDLELLKRSKIILDAMLEEENMVILVITFAVVTVAVNAIRRLSVDYSWYIATGTGAMAYLAVSIAGSFINGGLDNLVPLVAGVAGAVVLTLVLQFFVFHVDYTKSEYLEYEDDEYHYYVKAVPKVVAANASESQERRRERQEQKAQQRAQREAEREARRAEKEQQAQEQRAQEEAARQQRAQEEAAREAELLQYENFGENQGNIDENTAGNFGENMAEELQNASGETEAQGGQDFGATIPYDFGVKEDKGSEENREPDFDLEAVEQALVAAGDGSQKDTGREDSSPAGFGYEEEAAKGKDSFEEEQEEELASVAPVLSPPEVDDIDFESKLEESLREL